MEYFFPQKLWKNVKPKKPPEKKANQQAKKKSKKKQKNTKAKAKGTYKNQTSNLNLYLVAKANTWPHANNGLDSLAA